MSREAVKHVTYQTNTMEPLSRSKELALASLLSGSSVLAAAKAAKVDRTTVHRWLNDPEFRNEFEYRRQELQATVRDRLSGMVHKALDALEKALDESDAKAALVLLKGLGFLTDDPAQSVTVNVGLEPPRRMVVTREEQRAELLRLLQEAASCLAPEELELLMKSVDTPANKISTPMIIIDDNNGYTPSIDR